MLLVKLNPFHIEVIEILAAMFFAVIAITLIMVRGFTTERIWFDN